VTSRPPSGGAEGLHPGPRTPPSLPRFPTGTWHSRCVRPRRSSQRSCSSRGAFQGICGREARAPSALRSTAAINPSTSVAALQRHHAARKKLGGGGSDPTKGPLGRCSGSWAPTNHNRGSRRSERWRPIAIGHKTGIVDTDNPHPGCRNAARSLRWTLPRYPVHGCGSGNSDLSSAFRGHLPHAYPRAQALANRIHVARPGPVGEVTRAEHPWSNSTNREAAPTHGECLRQQASRLHRRQRLLRPDKFRGLFHVKLWLSWGEMAET
jgi:hypothetical protein